MPGEVETRGSTQLDGKPLPWCKPSASRRDATAEEKLEFDPNLCMSVTSKATCRELISGIRLLRVPVVVGTKIAPAYVQKKLQFLGSSCIAPISAGPKLTTLL